MEYGILAPIAFATRDGATSGNEETIAKIRNNHNPMRPVGDTTRFQRTTAAATPAINAIMTVRTKPGLSIVDKSDFNSRSSQPRTNRHTEERDYRTQDQKRSKQKCENPFAQRHKTDQSPRTDSNHDPLPGNHHTGPQTVYR